jgi:hypothetical protein
LNDADATVTQEDDVGREDVEQILQQAGAGKVERERPLLRLLRGRQPAAVGPMIDPEPKAD